MAACILRGSFRKTLCVHHLRIATDVCFCRLFDQGWRRVEET
jgi:hypothetical protein